MGNLNLELATKRVVEIIKKYYNQTTGVNNISKKEGNDIVTDVDVFMEQNIIAELSKFYPTHSFFAEESGVTKKDENGDIYQWIIDPIDGTIQFASGLPDFGIVVALQKNGETILGVTYLPKLDELYTSIKGKGSFCNGKKLTVSKNKNLSNSVCMIFLGVKHKKETISKTCSLIERMLPSIRAIRIVGSSAAATCWLASGKIDAVINLKSSKGLGSTAGRLFIEEAGGKVTNTLGNPRQTVDTLLCSNGLIHEQIVNMINNEKISKTTDNFSK